MDPDNLDEPRVRRATASDWPALAGIDSLAATGDGARRDSIRGWCERGAVLMAQDPSTPDGPSSPLGYAVLEYTFFEQGFLTLLMTAPNARRRGVGTQLLRAAETTCATPKLFTSTNASNHAMRRLLSHAGWQRAGILHGLDEGDPELFYLCPRTRPYNDLSQTGTSTAFPA
ncbi:GNAT family N-acetyltransferase [Streptomyces sp. NBC_01725]|uniref:GNAT family N-acetyltransferase n=1 Tax=Streptomyces sp. NBC_01725 TaxID=2975923 RepID=UPI002E2CD134|nr:GNAT family N-acetyltransferase [Streptomyces sp. NBC_01725]